jgi:hypothetical protein
VVFQEASIQVCQALARNLNRLRHKRIVIWDFAERDLRFGRKACARFALEEAWEPFGKDSTI